jgi:hypothetical protein
MGATETIEAQAATAPAQRRRGARLRHADRARMRDGFAVAIPSLLAAALCL